MKPIKTLDELKKLAGSWAGLHHEFIDGDGCECFIVLNGFARSSKTIWYFPEGQPASDWQDTEVASVDGFLEPSELKGVTVKWMIYHDISEAYVEYVDDEALLLHTLIGQALENNALYEYVFDYEAAKEELEKMNEGNSE
tara:strand:+ start:14113 stop:14532 length:420 start_codon:yes stop_codon:yes gene_type:complete